jgi:hypothetical protein
MAAKIGCTHWSSTGQGGLSDKVAGSQYDWSISRGLLFEEFTRSSVFNYFAQPHKLIHTLIWLYTESTVKIVHRLSTDRAMDYYSLIEHCELNHRPIEVVVLDLTLLQRHCKCSI